MYSLLSMRTPVKSFLFVTLLTLAAIPHAFAQKTHHYLQPAHTFPQKLTWWDSIYLYTGFQTGNITYFTGFAPERDLRLNYNLYFAQIDMIDERGDTVQISPSKTFRSVSIGNDLFLFDQKEGYLRVMIKGDVSLAERVYFHLAKMEYVSGSNNSAGAGHAVDVRGTTSNYDRYFAQVSVYYFVDNNGKVYPASRAILKNLFPEYKVAIQDFSKRHKTNFLKEADVRQITQYANSLRRINQDSDNGIVVPANARISATLGDSMYRFKGFQDGIVSYQDGRQRALALNYNLITGEVEALESKDTVKLANSGFITTVNIDGTTYFRKPVGYIEILLSGGSQLGVVRTMLLSHSQAVVASSKYGPDNSYDPSTTSLDRVNYDRMFSRKNNYYMIDGRGSVYEASASAMRRLYPGAEKQLDDYIRLHNPDFQNELDLKQIVSYLATVHTK
jgi:hypothetical protein